MNARLPRRPALAALAGYVVLTLALTYPLVREFGRAIPGDSFDGWQNYWNLWWVRVALLDQHASPFFTNLLFHPTGVGLLFHTLNPFNGLLTLPIQLVAGLFPAYNSAVLFSFAVGGFGAYLLARYVLGPGSSRLSAFVAGVVFTFAPVHVAHLLGHMQVISLEWIPFAALYLLRCADVHRRTRDILLAALFLALVALCDWYFVFYCLIFTGVVALWVTWRAGADAARRHARHDHVTPATGLPLRSAACRTRRRAASWLRAILSLAAAWLIWAVALSPLLAPMIAEARQFRFMVPDPGHSRILSADLMAFITPQEFHPLWGQWAAEQAKVFTATVSEHSVFAGFTVLVLAALGVWAAGRARGEPVSAGRLRRGGSDFESPAGASLQLWPLATAVFFILALGPVLHVAGRTDLWPGGREIPLPYGWLAAVVPFMEITRSVSRFDIMVMLALAVLAAIGTAWLRRRAGKGLALLTLALILFEFFPAPYPTSAADTPAWYASLAADPRPGAVLNLPMNWDRPGYLLYQTVHGRPLTVAYISRDDPRTLTERAPVLQHFRHLGPDILAFDLARQGQQVLANLGVRWVVLDRYKMPGGAEREYTETTARLIFGSSAPAFSDPRITVYEVQPPASPEPYLTLGVGWEAFAVQSHSRAFTGRAPVIVYAPVATTATLRVTLAPGRRGARPAGRRRRLPAQPDPAARPQHGDPGHEGTGRPGGGQPVGAGLERRALAVQTAATTTEPVYAAQGGLRHDEHRYPSEGRASHHRQAHAGRWRASDHRPGRLARRVSPRCRDRPRVPGFLRLFRQPAGRPQPSQAARPRIHAAHRRSGAA